MDQSSSGGSGAPLRMTLELICLLRESSDTLILAPETRSGSFQQAYSK